jgi:hypothetical protein
MKKMAVKSGFFNSINNDRQYNAEDFGLMFEGVCSDGVLTTVGSLFEPTPRTGMSVNIGIGKGWFMKTWIYNDAPMNVEVDASDSLLGRIDAIVIDVDVSNLVRKDDILYVKGTAATHPDKPVMVNTATHKQYPICYITIPAGSTSINSANIENAISSGETPLCHAMLDLDENIQLGVRNGGTGKTSFTSGKVLVGNGTGAIQEKNIDATSGGTNGSSDLTTAGALYATKAALQTTFQAGVDTVYNAVVAKGVMPSSSTPSAIATAIRNIPTSTTHTQRKTITSNGTTDLSANHSYRYIDVNVPTGITPSGTKNITSNGTYDVTNYASANVNVQSGGGGGTVTFTETINLYALPNANMNVSGSLTLGPRIFFPKDNITGAKTTTSLYTGVCIKYYSTTGGNNATYLEGKDQNIAHGQTNVSLNFPSNAKQFGICYTYDVQSNVTNGAIFDTYLYITRAIEY